MGRRIWTTGLMGALVGAAWLAEPMAPASAHARLVASGPAEGAVLATAPKTVRLSFNSLVERSFARFSIAEAGGAPRPLKWAPAAGGPTRVLEVPLPPLRSGRHRLHWRVVSADGHPVEGTIAFTTK